MIEIAFIFFLKTCITAIYLLLNQFLKILSQNTDAFFLLPVDIPSVKESTVKKMIERYEKIDDGILFPTFNKETGHPTIISCSLVKEILSKIAKFQ